MCFFLVKTFGNTPLWLYGQSSLYLCVACIYFYAFDYMQTFVILTLMWGIIHGFIIYCISLLGCFHQRSYLFNASGQMMMRHINRRPRLYLDGNCIPPKENRM